MDRAAFLNHLRPLVTQDDAVADWLEPAVDFLCDHLDGDASHGFGHLLRVMRNARRIVDGERAADGGPDWQTIAAAVVLHDVINLAKDHPERHLASTKSAEAADAFYRDGGWFDADQRDRIAEAIRTHSFSSGLTPRSLEAKVVCDADRLESLGALGMARVFYVSGRLGRSIVEMDDPWAAGRPLDDATWAVDHFFAKLLGLRDGFHTATGRQMADQRHDFLVDYLRQLADEIGVEPPV